MKQVLSIGILLLLVACEGSRQPNDKQGTTSSQQTDQEHDQQEQNKRSELTEREWADQMLTFLLDKKWKQLAENVHQKRGLLLSKDLHINKGKDQTFKPPQVRNFANSEKVFDWGEQAGSGEPIKLSIYEFHDRYINDHNYRKADTIGWNKRVSSGNTLWNLTDRWPDASFAEYHFKGFDESYEGMDWSSLVIVWQFHQNKPRLIAVLHGQWTP